MIIIFCYCLKVGVVMVPSVITSDKISDFIVADDCLSFCDKYR